MANASEEGDGVAMEATPVPERLTVGAVLEALLLRVSVPLRVPRAEGVKETLIVQLPPEASVVPQLLVCAKSPTTLKLDMEREAVPELLSVIACAALVVLTRCAA